MNTSVPDIRGATITHVTVTDDTLTVDLADGRSISAPLAWYPRLLHGTSDERNRWRLIGRSGGIHWPDLDEDISVENLLAGQPSGESQASFQTWLARRGIMQRSEELESLAAEHRGWLSQFNAQYLKNWEKLHAADYEAALTEASVRRMLQRNDVTVEPNERLKSNCGGPDFRCSTRDTRFYVEVTSISIATAEKKLGIKNGASGFSPFNVMGMTEAIFNECMNKAPQCADLDGPALVAVGTFHGTAAMVGFEKSLVNTVLTGKTEIAWNIDTQIGEQVGETYQTTKLHAAAFLRPDKTDDVGFARSSISGILLCAVGLASLRTIGVLHPNPARPFDPELLPRIEFGHVELDRKSKQLHVKWLHGNHDL